MANVTQMRPESRGRITLRGADPAAAPVIRPNYVLTTLEHEAG